ncbi:ABC transporter permease subunit [Spirochaeta isovalerica]|uniref:Peptide/nickel transport system permease protein n=1 Tax=Spirochaeta isovalerica TaxID=150 RepID=A0A841R870_9SPIO|nr:peptide/nickel transport system permease protein [Spirochaeta isovalerica]
MNLEFRFGIALLLILILIAIFGPRFAPYDPEFSESVRTVVVDGRNEYIFAPELPGKRHPLGTDKDGYDFLTMILYGAKYTIGACFLIALLRIVPGLVWGIAAGMKKPNSRKMESAGAIPAFVILFFILAGMTFNTTISTGKLFFIQTSMIALIGIPGVIAAIQEKTWLQTQETYIEAARSCGAGGFRIALRHIFPHLRGTTFTVFMTEVISSLNLIGQLAIFSIFLGGTIATESPPLLHSATNEWMGIIALTKNSINNRPWMLFVPMTAYLLILISLNLILHGIEKYYGEKYGKTPFL